MRINNVKNFLNEINELLEMKLINEDNHVIFSYRIEDDDEYSTYDVLIKVGHHFDKNRTPYLEIKLD